VDVVWPAPGTVLSLRYRLVTQLSSGGMSQVWRAEDELLGRPVAIKLPTSSAEVVKQAFTEARTTARLSHPHIAAVHDYGETKRPDGSLAPFVVMELLDGPSLAARLADGPLGWPEAARIGAQLAEGLAAAHTRQVVHRDVKPGNVMLTPGGVRILDFGISAMVGAPDDDDTGATFGTPAYVAPERLDGKPAEPATDVYGLGVVLFEMVTGDPPYPVDTWEELAAARAKGPDPLPDGLPEEFHGLVLHCLADDPADRPTAAEARDALAALVPAPADDGSGDEASARPAFTPGRASAATLDLQAPVRRRVATVVVAAAALLAVAGVVAALNTGRGPSDPASIAAPAATVATPAPAATPAPPPSSTPASVAPTTRATADYDEAVARVRTAVEDGLADGWIREDVATDLLNLIRPLRTAESSEVGDRVAEVRRKVRDRVSEGSVAEAQGDELEARLADVDRAAGA
jgi:eukaryotic-like serine/threonine-protein kinase